MNFKTYVAEGGLYLAKNTKLKIHLTFSIRLSRDIFSYSNALAEPLLTMAEQITEEIIIVDYSFFELDSFNSNVRHQNENGSCLSPPPHYAKETGKRSFQIS